MRHPFFSTIIGERQQRAAVFHQLFGALGDGREAIAGNEHGLAEVVSTGVDIASGQFVLVGKGNGVNHEVQLPPGLFDGRKCRIDRGHVRHVAGHYKLRADFGGQGLNPFLDGIALIREGQFRPMPRAGLRNPPGNRPVIGNAHDQPAFASHQAFGIVHDFP